LNADQSVTSDRLFLNDGYVHPDGYVQHDGYVQPDGYVHPRLAEAAFPIEKWSPTREVLVG